MRTTVVSLRELHPHSYGPSFVEVFGHTAVGDGGGGTFYWDESNTDDDNGGTVIAYEGSDSGRWVRNVSGAYSIKWFGAKGDLVTDDAPALRACLTAASAAGAAVYLPSLPAGYGYRMGSGVDVGNSSGYVAAAPLPAGMSIFGDGYGSALFWPGANPGGSPPVDNKTYDILHYLASNVQISNLRIYGENGDSTGSGYQAAGLSSQAGHSAIAGHYWFGHPSSQHGVSIHDVWVENVWGFACAGNEGVDQQMTIDRFSFRYCANGLNPYWSALNISNGHFWHAEGIETQSSSVNISNITIRGVVSAISCTGQVGGSRTETNYTHGIQITNVTVDGSTMLSSSSANTSATTTTGDLVTITGYNAISISNSHFKDPYQNALSIARGSLSGTVDPRNISITGNTFMNERTAGEMGGLSHFVVATNVRGLRITGNGFHDPGHAIDFAIKLTASGSGGVSRDTTITGNTFDQLKRTCVCTTGSVTGVVVMGNVMRDYGSGGVNGFAAEINGVDRLQLVSNICTSVYSSGVVDFWITGTNSGVVMNSNDLRGGVGSGGVGGTSGFTSPGVPVGWRWSDGNNGVVGALF